MVDVVNANEQVRDVIVIGASAGGIQATTKLLSLLPPNLPAAIGFVIHRGPVAHSNWAQLLGRDASLRVHEPIDGESIQLRHAYIAPADKHMTFGAAGIRLSAGPKVHHVRPAADPLFASAAKAFGARVLGIVMTGCGYDGMQGLRAISAAGGLCLVQSPSEAEHAWMPEYALAHDHVKASLTIRGLAEAVIALANGQQL